MAKSPTPWRRRRRRGPVVVSFGWATHIGDNLLEGGGLRAAGDAGHVIDCRNLVKDTCAPVVMYRRARIGVLGQTPSVFSATRQDPKDKVRHQDTGLDGHVARMVLGQIGARAILDNALSLLDNGADTVFLGCSRGRHRSVALAEEVARTAMCEAGIWREIQ